MAAAHRPLVQVWNPEVIGEKLEQILMPTVLLSPLRPDVVRFVHTQMAKNKRQPYAVSKIAGTQTSAQSWGTGRAVARIPRVAGGGTRRSGEGAFGNMCRGGRMFAPTKVWRRWHRRINVTEKRFALCSSLAATALPAMVMARGHRIEKVEELPLVIGDGIHSVQKTAAAVALLKRINCYDDVEKVMESKQIRTGRGKMRNRRYTKRKGPLIVYSEDLGLVKGFRNIPGVELCHVDRLNLLQLAPGGHLGRFVIWSKGAFEKVDKIYGSYRTASVKKNFTIPRPMMTNADLSRLINSDEVQSVVRPAKEVRKVYPQRKNALKNKNVMVRLNPYSVVTRRKELLQAEKRKLEREKKKKKVAKA